ncbi:MAG: GTP cyclohydrolase I FolE [bacterium TMED198]|nr:MAG: GTP cyclohydrolase I FolE [bacterium TMED198]|tara:strand:- start:455 stop:1150 length:696 start_codon:yes stop_codon:yes gene_type:complete
MSKKSIDKVLKEEQLKFENQGDDHSVKSIDTPMREGAFEKSSSEKINLIKDHFYEIMDILGLDMSDDSLKGTPYRVAKMYVSEIFNGLDEEHKPKVTLFDNKYQYGKMLVERDISYYSMCEHHFMPIYGKAHIAYISSGKVIGLSKLHRIVKYFASRPQVQERMTVQVFQELKKVLNTEDVAVMIDGFHMCVSARGTKDITSSTVTMESGGSFREDRKWAEFMELVKPSKR